MERPHFVAAAAIDAAAAAAAVAMEAAAAVIVAAASKDLAESVVESGWKPSSVARKQKRNLQIRQKCLPHHQP